jgi:molecular chaperone GrpE (heat shock protein)
VKAEKSNTLEAAALARVAEAAREVHAASAAIEAHSTAVNERQASALKVTRLTAAIQELEDAGLALAAVIDDVNRRVHKEHRLSADAGALTNVANQPRRFDGANRAHASLAAC